MTERTDVAIIGGGAIGSAIAYFLLRDAAGGIDVTVIERDPSYRRASSALSASSIRQQFSTPENIRLSQFGFGFLRDIERHLRIDDPLTIGLHEGGYLYLAPPGHEAPLRENHAVQRAEGAAIALLAAGDLARKFPWLETADVALGALGLAGEGWFDGYGLMQAFRRKARALGARYLAAEAVGIEVAAGRAERIRLGDGTTLGCGTVVNAAGPWARQVAAMAGLTLPVEARRRCVFVFDARRQLADCPLVIDTSGIWFRPEGAHFICGTSPPPAEDADGLPLEVDHRQFDDILWPALAARVPAFAAIKPINAWAGYYEYNAFDQNAVIGPHPALPNFIFANGFSGHGIQHSPGVGRAVAELVRHGRYLSLDLAVFGYERIAAGRKIVERNVIG
ncbi:MAG: FAD-binding oxidoreductase [Rhodospirillaceae bacterium]|nr:FAD-binding oxidoreductase [Rhodospirillaceae bacterium]